MIAHAHGFYVEDPKLDFTRLDEIRKLVKVPLVLHGGTGIPEDQIQKAITMGISKVNFSSVLRRAYIDRVHEYLNEKPDEISIMDIMSSAKESMKKKVEECILMCMCDHKY